MPTPLPRATRLKRAIVVGAVGGTEVALHAVARAADWTLAGVVTLPPELAANHSDFVDVGSIARSLGGEVVHAPNINAAEVLDQIRELEPDIVFVIGWSQICRSEFLAIAPGGTIGYHPAPLPRLRGRAVIPWTILLNEPITAGTLFWIDAGVDSGPIVAQQFFHVAPDETAATLYDRHMTALATMLDEALPLLAAGQAPRRAQDERFATYAAKRTPADGRIDWSRRAGEIARLIRAVGRPYPGAFTTAATDTLTIWAAELCGPLTRHAALPGQVVERDEAGFVVVCGDGCGLRMTEWDGPRPRQHSRLGEGAPWTRG